MSTNLSQQSNLSANQNLKKEFKETVGANLTNKIGLGQNLQTNLPAANLQNVGLQSTVLQSNMNIVGAGAPIIERTFESAPVIIKHEEQTIFETHNVPTIVDKIEMPVKIETHINQPIIKEHHKEIIHEHHQNIIHEHHKNIIHEQHQNIIHEFHQPIIHKEDIREIHQPVIHEKHQEIIHDIAKPVIHEQHKEVIEEQFKGPVVHEEFTKPVIHEEFAQPIIEKTVQETIIQKEGMISQQEDLRMRSFTAGHSAHSCRLHTKLGCRDCLECLDCDKFRKASHLRK